MSPDKRSLILKLAILLGVIIVVLWIATTVLGSRGFRVVKTDPNLKGVSTIAPYLKVTFDRDITDKDLSISSSPDITTTHSVNGRTLTIMLLTMNRDQTYTINLDKVTSKDGEVLRDKKLTFKAKSIDYDRLSREQQKVIDERQKTNFVSPKGDPILAFLPHNAVDFTLTAVVGAADASGQGKVSLKAELIMSQADLSNPEQATLAYKQQVLDYIRSIGFDPEKYQIEYQMNINGVLEDPEFGGHDEDFYN